MGGIIQSPNYITGDVTITGGNVRIATAGKGAELNLGGAMCTAFNSAANDIAVGSIVQPGNMNFYGGVGMGCRFYTSMALTAEFKGGNGATAGLYLRGETQGIYSHQQVAKAWASVDPGTQIYTGYGVASLTDIGVGNTLVNFVTAFADENYAAVITDVTGSLSTVIKTPAYVQVVTGVYDVPFSVAIFR